MTSNLPASRYITYMNNANTPEQRAKRKRILYARWYGCSIATLQSILADTSKYNNKGNSND